MAKEHLKSSVAAIKLLAALKACISKARIRQSIIHESLQCFEIESRSNSKNRPYSLTLSKLNEFIQAEDPFAGLQTEDLASLLEQQRSILKELASKKDEIRAKISITKKRKKVWKVTCTAAFVSVLVLSLALAAMSAPPVATVAASCGCAMIKTAEQWLDSIWADRMETLEGEKEVVVVMGRGEVRVDEMESIQAMMGGLEIDIGLVSYYAGFATRREEKAVVAMVMGEIKGKVGVVGEWIDGAEMKVDACYDEIKKGIAEFLKVIASDL